MTSDEKRARAQGLLFEVDELRQRGEDATGLLREMAVLHRQLACEKLRAGDADGWTDFYASITASVEAGDFDLAYTRIRSGKTLAQSFPGADNIVAELNRHAEWAEGMEREP